MNQTPKPLFVSFLLDETGSMNPIAAPTIRAVNDYMDGLKGGKAEVLFSLVTFNSSETRARFASDPIDTVRHLTSEDYRPAAMTPLIDACCKLIEATDRAVQEKNTPHDVLVVIQTDGHENCSVEYTASDLAASVKKHEAEGWQFLFLGAGLDAFNAAQYAGLDISADRVASYDRGRTDQAMGILRQKSVYFRDFREASNLDFVSSERRQMAANPTPPPTAKRARKQPDPKPRSEKRGTVDEISLTRR